MPNEAWCGGRHRHDDTEPGPERGMLDPHHDTCRGRQRLEPARMMP
jgi:hypothetical protein